VYVHIQAHVVNHMLVAHGMTVLNASIAYLLNGVALKYDVTNLLTN
jgi:hypothetical protein